MDSSELARCVLIRSTGKGYHPFQILFARMSITVICSSLYMWHKKTEHFPWGLREIRPLLVARGLTGFFGVFGMYCKLLVLAVWYNNVLQALTASSYFWCGATALIAILSWLSCWDTPYLHHPIFHKRGADLHRFIVISPSRRCDRHHVSGS